MSKKSKRIFFVGGVVGAVIGTVAGILLAPRSGADSRAVAADAMNNAWDKALDTYEHHARSVSDYMEVIRPKIDTASDELRAKIDAARERMTQVRSSLSDTVVTLSSHVSDSVATSDSQSASTAGHFAQSSVAQPSVSAAGGEDLLADADELD